MLRLKPLARALLPVALAWASLALLHHLLAGALAEDPAVTVALATGRGLVGVGALVLLRLALYLVLPPVAAFRATRAALEGLYSPAQRSSTPPS